jgi:hypothetical protein
VLIGASGVLTGCGLFDLRDPEPPAGSEVIFDTPTQPRIALKNIEATTEARFIGNYQRSLSTDYKFRFDPFDAGTDTVWALDRELQAMTQLFRNDATVNLTWTVRDSGSLGEDFFYRNLGYRLVFRRSGGDSLEFGGRCTLYFRNDGIQWLIYRMADLKDETADRTWGYARLNPIFQ